MLKKLLPLLLMCLLPVSSYALAAVDPNADMVKQTIAGFMQENDIPGVAVQVYVEGKPQSYYFGYANKIKKTPVTKNTIFEVGSITKILTSLLLAQQVDMAKVTIDKPVTDYVSGLPAAFDDMSLMNLATHTSGLPFNFPVSVATRAQADTYLDNWEPVYATDQEWVYSNVGMGILGEALEKMNNRNLEQLYQRNILSPLKMTPFALAIPARYKKFVAQGYDAEGNPVQPEKEIYPAAGALKISALDMQKLLGAAVGVPGTPGRVLYPMRLTQAAYVKLPDRLQGLAWQIHPLEQGNIESLLDDADQRGIGPVKVSEIFGRPKYNGDALIDKTGSTNGFRTYMAVIPNKQVGIVIMANRALRNDAMVKVGREILFTLAKVKAEDVEEGG